MVAIGIVRRAVGLDGRVEVELYSRVPGTAAQSSGDGVTVLKPGAEFSLRGRKLAVDRTGNGRKGLIGVYFRDVTDRNSSEALRGVELELPESALPPLPEGAYYHYQLIGCAVVDLSGGTIGTLSGIMETGANDVYVVTGEDGKDLLIPATKDTVKEIDTVKRLMTVDPPSAVVSQVAPD